MSQRDALTKDQIMQRIFEESEVIAVVGASNDPERAGYYIPRYLKEQGYRIIPVNPNHDSVLGQPCYDSLADIPEPVDCVEVFRRPEYCADVARQAAAIGARSLWLQLGIFSLEAEQIAEEAGMLFVQDDCMGPQHRRLARAG